MTATDHLGPQFDWRDQPFKVMGREQRLGNVSGGRMYHGSPHEIAAGALIEPGVREANHKESPGGSVSVTSVEDNARRWGKMAADPGKDVHVYEVEPIHPLEPHRVGPADQGRSFHVHEARTRGVRVVREV